MRIKSQERGGGNLKRQMGNRRKRTTGKHDHYVRKKTKKKNGTTYVYYTETILLHTFTVLVKMGLETGRKHSFFAMNKSMLEIFTPINLFVNLLVKPRWPVFELCVFLLSLFLEKFI